MRGTTGLWLLLLLGCSAGSAAAARIPVTTCGQVLRGHGELTGDLDCGLYAGTVAVTVRGKLDLNGFTITGHPGLDAINCDVKCKVRGPGRITGAHNGVSQVRNSVAVIVRVRDLTIDGNSGAAVDGTYVQVKNSIVTNNGNPNPPVESHFPYTGGVTGSRVKILGSTLTNNTNFGVNSADIRLIRSTVTGNGTNPGCLPQSQNLGCADIATLNFPRVTRTSTCGTSRRTAALNESWGVCTDD